MSEYLVLLKTHHAGGLATGAPLLDHLQWYMPMYFIFHHVFQKVMWMPSLTLNWLFRDLKYNYFMVACLFFYFLHLCYILVCPHMQELTKHVCGDDQFQVYRKQGPELVNKYKWRRIKEPLQVRLVLSIIHLLVLSSNTLGSDCGFLHINLLLQLGFE